MGPGPAPGADLALLGLLQLADSSFPSGAYTLSHGLETLVAERVIRAGGDLAAYLAVCLRHRLAWADLPALLAAADAREVDAVIAIDRRLDACKLAADDRLGSSRVGRRLAVESSRLVDAPLLAAVRSAIETRRSPGHAAVVFGVAACALGASRRTAALAAASSFVSGVIAAAVRLSLIGHGEGQRLLRGAAPSIVAAVDVAEGVDWRDLRPSAPQHEIALARHEASDMRLFAS